MMHRIVEARTGQGLAERRGMRMSNLRRFQNGNGALP